MLELFDAFMLLSIWASYPPEHHKSQSLLSLLLLHLECRQTIKYTGPIQYVHPKFKQLQKAGALKKAGLQVGQWIPSGSSSGCAQWLASLVVSHGRLGHHSNGHRDCAPWTSSVPLFLDEEFLSCFPAFPGCELPNVFTILFWLNLTFISRQLQIHMDLPSQVTFYCFWSKDNVDKNSGGFSVSSGVRVCCWAGCYWPFWSHFIKEAKEQ